VSAPLVPIRLIRPAPLASRSALTLAQAAPQFLGWFRYVRQRTENTVMNYGQDLRSFLAFCDRIGISTPDQVHFPEVEMYLAALQHERGCKPPTVNRHRFAVSSFFRYLCRVGIVAANPTDDVFPLKTPKRLPTYLTIPEQERVLEVMAADATPMGRRDHALIATGLFCGLRVEEVCHLRLADVDLDASPEAGRLRVVAGKGDKDREAPIIPRLREILRAYLAEVRPQLQGRRPGCVWQVDSGGWRSAYWRDGRRHYKPHRTEADARAWLKRESPLLPDGGWFFVNANPTGGHRQHRAGKPLLTRSVHALVHRVVSPIVGRPIHPHALRHSFASRLRYNGAGIELIQEALGHADIRTTAIYAHLPTAKRNAELVKLLG
jgi:integrase/recombinase XerC